MIERQIRVNQHGLAIEVEAKYIASVKEWCFDVYNCAKLMLYHDRTELLAHDEEQRQIAMLISSGVFSQMNDEKGGNHA